MKIEYFGHSCVRLTAADGTRILIDPFDGVGYPMPRVRADIVLCTHGHFDHHYTEGVEGAREVIEAVGSYDRGGVHIEGIASFHDDCGGRKRGKNVIFVVDDGQARVCHMGDIGELPRADLLRAGLIRSTPRMRSRTSTRRGRAPPWRSTIAAPAVRWTSPPSSGSARWRAAAACG